MAAGCIVNRILKRSRVLVGVAASKIVAIVIPPSQNAIGPGLNEYSRRQDGQSALPGYDGPELLGRILPSCLRLLLCWELSSYIFRPFAIADRVHRIPSSRRSLYRPIQGER